MKKVGLVIIATVIMFTACKEDKNAKLDKLKSEYEKLGNEIKTLESEIKNNGDSTSVISSSKIATLVIKKSPFNHYIEVQGRIDGSDNVIATSKTLGVVTKVNVKEGDAVQKGQVLAELDAQVMTQTLEELNTSLVFVKDLYEKQKALWDQKIGSEVQYLSAKNNYEGMQNRINTIKEQAEMYKIISPISGTIEEAPLKVGQSMAPGLIAFRVINFSMVKVVSEVSESYATNIKKGNEVKISFPDVNKEFSAKIDFTSRFINPTNRTFTIESYLKPGDIEYRANMITIMKILDYNNDSAIVLPVNLIQSDSKGQFVWVAQKQVKGYKAVKNIVTQGKSYNGLTEILTGINEGDIVLTSNLFDLQEGKEIEL